MNDSALTVIICCYNAQGYLSDCLYSLAKQSVSDYLYEVLFIDDASNDRSVRIAETYARQIRNFKIITNRINEGLVNCCNSAIEKIETPYFVRLDADDKLSCDSMQKMLGELKDPSQPDFILFNRWDILDDKATEVNLTNDIYTWIASGTLFRTNTVRSAGGYDNEHWEEYDLYIKLLERGCSYKLSSYRTYYYRRGHTSMTKNFIKNKLGFENLSKKWGADTLKKYGNFLKIAEYYGINE